MNIEELEARLIKFLWDNHEDDGKELLHDMLAVLKENAFALEAMQKMARGSDIQKQRLMDDNARLRAAIERANGETPELIYIGKNYTLAMLREVLEKP